MDKLRCFKWRKWTARSIKLARLEQTHDSPVISYCIPRSCDLVSQDVWNGKSCKPLDLHRHGPIGITPRSQKSIYLGTTASTTMRGHCLESCASHPIDRSHNRAGISFKFIRSATIAGRFIFQASASLFKHKFCFCFVSEQNIASPHGNNGKF